MSRVDSPFRSEHVDFLADGDNLAVLDRDCLGGRLSVVDRHDVAAMVDRIRGVLGQRGRDEGQQGQ